MRGKILLVGTISNGSNTFMKDLNRVTEAFSSFFEVEFFLVESDSSDNTVTDLEMLHQTLTGFSFVSFGELKRTIPDRIERIRYCRNVYIDYIRRNFDRQKWAYVVVADLDGMNPRISAKGVQSCFLRSDWDVCLSNQTGGYYDVLALRHPEWQPNDYIQELNELKGIYGQKKILSFPFLRRVAQVLFDDQIRRKVLYSKMRVLPADSNWIEVESGFGGLAIYKSYVFLNHDYSTTDSNPSNCEHVDFHSKIRNDGHKIFINPGFINADWNTYNVNRFFIVRQIRRLVWNSTFLYRVYLLVKRYFFGKTLRPNLTSSE